MKYKTKEVYISVTYWTKQKLRSSCKWNFQGTGMTIITKIYFVSHFLEKNDNGW